MFKYVYDHSPYGCPQKHLCFDAKQSYPAIMYLCVCTYVRTYVYVRIHTYTYAHTCIHIHIYIHTYIYIYISRQKFLCFDAKKSFPAIMYVCMYTCKHVYMYPIVCMRICICKWYVNASARIILQSHAFIMTVRIYKYIYTHTCMYASVTFFLIHCRCMPTRLPLQQGFLIHTHVCMYVWLYVCMYGYLFLSLIVDVCQLGFLFRKDN
jgi:hypothetical protein